MKYCIMCGSLVVSGHRQFKDHLQHCHPQYDGSITSYFQDRPPVAIHHVGSKRSRSPDADSGDPVGDVEGSNDDEDIMSRSERDSGDVGGSEEESDGQEMRYHGSDDNIDGCEEPLTEDTSGWPCPTGDQDLQGRLLYEMDDMQASWHQDEECPFILEAGEWPVPANWQLCEDEVCQKWTEEDNIDEPTVDWAALSTHITRLPWEKMILFLTRFFIRFRIGKMQQVEIIKLISALIPASLLPTNRAAWKKAQVDALNIPLPQKIPFCPTCQKICPKCLSALCCLPETKDKCLHSVCEVCQTHRKSFTGLNVVPGIQAFMQAYDAMTVTPGHFLVGMALLLMI